MLRLAARTAVGAVAVAARATSSVTLAAAATQLRVALLPALQPPAKSSRSSSGPAAPTDATNDENLTHMLGFEALGPASAPADSAADESFGDRLKRWLRDARPGQQEPAPAVKNVELSENAGEVDEDMCDDDAVDVGSMGSGRRAGASARPSWMGGMWLAVPKRKPSYARKRRRQMNPLYANDKTLDHAYPCPKCAKGLIKLRHHLCPCDQEALNCRAVVKVRYGIAKRRVAAEEAAAAKAAAAAAAPAAATPSA